MCSGEVQARPSPGGGANYVANVAELAPFSWVEKLFHMQGEFEPRGGIPAHMWVLLLRRYGDPARLGTAPSPSALLFPRSPDGQPSILDLHGSPKQKLNGGVSCSPDLRDEVVSS